jgi:hypothetical protein
VMSSDRTGHRADLQVLASPRARTARINPANPSVGAIPTFGIDSA